MIFRFQLLVVVVAMPLLTAKEPQCQDWFDASDIGFCFKIIEDDIKFWDGDKECDKLKPGAIMAVWNFMERPKTKAMRTVVGSDSVWIESTQRVFNFSADACTAMKKIGRPFIIEDCNKIELKMHVLCEITVAKMNESQMVTTTDTTTTTTTTESIPPLPSTPEPSPSKVGPSEKPKKEEAGPEDYVYFQMSVAVNE